MKKNNNNNNNAKNTVSSTVKINVEKKAVVQTSEYLSVIFTTLYLLVHFVTDWGGADVMGSQWLYTGTLDFFVLGYIIINVNQYNFQTRLNLLVDHLISLGVLVHVIRLQLEI